MSRDIQRFITGANRSGARKPPRVLPSTSTMAASHVPAHSSIGSYPKSSLVLSPVRERAAIRCFKASSGEDDPIDELHRQDSLGLGPRVYTGSAELRGGISPTLPQPTTHDESGRGGQQLDLVHGENASAADVVSDLEGVLKQLRGRKGGEQLAGSSGHLTPRANLPINFAQIAHDLEAKLLEFTLTVKAREQAAEEGLKVQKAEEDAWRKRVEETVRHEHARLQDAADSKDYAVSPNGSRAFEDADNMLLGVNSKMSSSEGDHQTLRTFSARNPILAPSALDVRTFNFLEHANAPAEAVTHEMAAILRAVEAEVQRIEAFEVDGSRDHEKRGPRSPRDLVAPAASGPGTIDSSLFITGEDGKERGEDTDGMKDVNLHGNEKPLVSEGDRDELAVKPDVTLATGGGSIDTDPTLPYIPRISYNNSLEHFFISREAQGFPNLATQPWLRGQTSLQETGRCIGAELEVAMLCMQKRLGKEPLGEQDATARVGKSGGPGDSVPSNVTENPKEKVSSATEIGVPSEVSSREVLQVLADDMEIRREQENHTERDRELGLDFNFMDDPDDRWCESRSPATHLDHGRRVLHYHGRPQEPSYPYPLNHATWAVPLHEAPQVNKAELMSKKATIGASPFNTRWDMVVGRALPATVRHPVPQSSALQSRLQSAEEEMFSGKIARTRDLSVLDNKIQRPPLDGRVPRKDVYGGGFAIARARRRLHSFRTARQKLSTSVNVTHSHNESCASPMQLQFVDRQAMLHFQDAKKTLRKLKGMRYSLKGTVK